MARPNENCKLQKQGYNQTQIAKALRVSDTTISRELRRGTYDHQNYDYTFTKTYSPDKAQERYELNKTAKGVPLKIGNDHALADYIERKIADEKYSPAAVLAEIKNNPELKFSTTICHQTLYNYISKGVFRRITNKSLPFRGKRRKHKTRKVRAARVVAGESIEQRHETVDNRTEFGHWEMDTVVSTKGKKACLLVLTERLSRHQITMKIPDKTSASVVSVINYIERKYKRLFSAVFKSITVDNGSEFSDCRGMELSKKGKARTKLYYCHPYSSWERGSNEKQNQMLRRWFPKGTNFGKVTAKAIKKATDWLNDYPRKLLDWRTSRQVFQIELAKLGINRLLLL